MRTRATAWLLAVLAVPGCLSLEKGYPERRFYVLELPSSAGDRAVASEERVRFAGTVQVRPFRLDAPHDGEQFVYRQSDGETVADFYHQFFSPPAAMITQATRESLSHSRLFDQVVAPGSRLDSDYVLEGSVLRLHGDFSDSSDPTAVLGLQLMLIERADGDPSVLFTRDYEERISIAVAEPTPLALAWSDALGRILAAFRSDLAGLAKS